LLAFKSFCRFEKKKEKSMDNLLELLPYIIAIIIFLVRIFSGNKEQSADEPTPETVPQNTKKNETKSAQQTFDDLFKQLKKQIQEAEKTPQKTLKQPKQEKKPQQKKNLDVVNPERGLTQEQRKGDQHFSPYQIHQQTQSPFAKILKDKNTFKQAFIVSEILNRKYF
jgi:cell pole-organizing protein PopZ